MEIKVYCETHPGEELYVATTGVFLDSIEIMVHNCQKCLDTLAELYEKEE
jgi:hypothetical protein